MKSSSENVTCDNDITNQTSLSQLGVHEDKNRNKKAVLGRMIV